MIQNIISIHFTNQVHAGRQDDINYLGHSKTIFIYGLIQVLDFRA